MLLVVPLQVKPPFEMAQMSVPEPLLLLSLMERRWAVGVWEGPPPVVVVAWGREVWVFRLE